MKKRLATSTAHYFPIDWVPPMREIDLSTQRDIRVLCDIGRLIPLWGYGTWPTIRAKRWARSMFATRDVLEATPSQRRQYGWGADGFRSEITRLRPDVGQKRPSYCRGSHLTEAILCLHIPTSFRPVGFDGRLRSLWPKFDARPLLSALRL